MKRYDIINGHAIEHGCGKWVYYSTDVEPLEKEIEALRGSLSLAEEGLANYAQELEKLTQSNLQFIVANKSLADDNVALRETPYQIQQWRLTWAMACQDDECKACQQFDKELRSVLPKSVPHPKGNEHG